MLREGNTLIGNSKFNQYLNWSLCPTGLYKHDDQWYGAAGNGVLMQEGSVTASYNALNQPIAIYAPGLGSNFMYFGFDPLGRCVKRWIAPSTAGHLWEGDKGAVLSFAFLGTGNGKIDAMMFNFEVRP